MALIHSVSNQRVTQLTEGFEVRVTAPGACRDPDALLALSLPSQVSRVPGVIATLPELLPAGCTPDTCDAWYSTTFASSVTDAKARRFLRLAGLATLAEVWLNGTHVLASNNMFHEHTLDVTDLLGTHNSLTLCFRSLDAELKRRKGRPRWRTRLVQNQKLCQIRTTLLGRMPGFTPALPAVGPWRTISIEERRGVSVETADLRTELSDQVGVATLRLKVRELSSRVRAGKLVVGEHSVPLSVSARSEGQVELTGKLSITKPRLWWPHTHGEQPRYTAHAELELDAEQLNTDFGEVAFRSIQLSTQDAAFELMLNGVAVFCRGACWTPLDVKLLHAEPELYARALDQVRAAGMNMLRLSGTMIYESDAFYRACDERGIMLWQDFMFANMDYPALDPDFHGSVETEAQTVLSRLQTHPSLVVLAGGSEVHQQAAMLGLPRDAWQSRIFDELLPSLARAFAPDVPYVPSTPHGGSLPFRTNAGVSHYFGVGAYLRPLEDARRAEVRFAAEALAFANVPEPETVELVLGGGEAPAQHPRWKAGVPRDSGSGWDFEDVRDHYVKTLFEVDPVAVRYSDPERYLALGRAATGEVMAATFSEWRRSASTCRGALIWFLRDLVPGAGFGVVDALGVPKSAYFYLKRTLQPVALLVTDEGLNGLALHAVNETTSDFRGSLRLAVYRAGHVKVAEAAKPIVLAARSQTTLNADDLLESFLDITHAYRFGPAPGDVVAATLLDADGNSVTQAFYFPRGHAALTDREEDLGLKAYAEEAPDGYRVQLVALRFAHTLVLSAPGFVPDDNYFHLEPGVSRTIRLEPLLGAKRFSLHISALNAPEIVRVSVVHPAHQTEPVP